MRAACWKNCRWRLARNPVTTSIKHCWLTRLSRGNRKRKAGANIEFILDASASMRSHVDKKSARMQDVRIKSGNRVRVRKGVHIKGDMVATLVDKPPH